MASKESCPKSYLITSRVTMPTTMPSSPLSVGIVGDDLGETHPDLTPETSASLQSNGFIDAGRLAAVGFTRSKHGLFVVLPKAYRVGSPQTQVALIESAILLIRLLVKARQLGIGSVSTSA